MYPISRFSSKIVSYFPQLTQIPRKLLSTTPASQSEKFLAFVSGAVTGLATKPVAEYVKSSLIRNISNHPADRPDLPHSQR